MRKGPLEDTVDEIAQNDPDAMMQKQRMKQMMAAKGSRRSIQPLARALKKKRMMMKGI